MISNKKKNIQQIGFFYNQRYNKHVQFIVAIDDCDLIEMNFTNYTVLVNSFKIKLIRLI